MAFLGSSVGQISQLSPEQKLELELKYLKAKKERFDKQLVFCKNADKKRIIETWESKVLQSISDSTFSCSIFNPGEAYSQYEHFKDI